MDRSGGDGGASPPTFIAAMGRDDAQLVRAHGQPLALATVLLQNGRVRADAALVCASADVAQQTYRNAPAAMAAERLVLRVAWRGEADAGWTRVDVPLRLDIIGDRPVNGSCKYPPSAAMCPDALVLDSLGALALLQPDGTPRDVFYSSFDLGYFSARSTGFDLTTPDVLAAPEQAVRNASLRLQFDPKCPAECPRTRLPVMRTDGRCVCRCKTGICKHGGCVARARGRLMLVR